MGRDYALVYTKIMKFVSRNADIFGVGCIKTGSEEECRI